MLKNRQSSTITVKVYLGQFRETAKLIDLTVLPCNHSTKLRYSLY